LLATCDLLEQPPDTEEPPPDLTEDDGMARITVKVEGLGAPRALNAANATPSPGAGPGAANYYEVVFKHGTRYYETAWLHTAGSAPITVPIANYDNTTTTNDAVLFAGFQNGTDYTLLGVGRITGNANVTDSTSSVTFSVTALTNKVYDESDPNDLESFTFKITGPTAYATATTDNSPAIAPVGSGTTFPAFPVPGYDTGTSTPYQGGDITAAYSVTIPHNDAVILQDAWSVASVTLASWPGGETAVTGVEYTPTDKTSGSALDATTTFEFEIDVSAITYNGLCAFVIDAPVRALSSTATYENTQAVKPTIVWHIRGGTVTTTADNGSNNGAAVILAVGTHFNP